MPATRKRRTTDPDPPLPLPRRLVVVAPPAPPPVLDVPRRLNVNAGEPPPPTNVVSLPTRNKTVASPQAAAEVPLDLPTYTRPAATSVPVEPTVGNADPFLPTRPRRAHPKGTVEYQDQLLTDLQTGPTRKMSRKKAALLGFLRGLGTGNILTAGIGAAVGAAAPGATSRLALQDEIANASAALDTSIGREGALSQIAARRNQPQREIDAARRAEREKRIANVMTMHGRAGHYNPDDPNDQASQVIRSQAEELGIADQLIPYTEKDRVPSTREVEDAEGVVMQFERGPDGLWRPAKGLPTRKKDYVNVPGYGRVTVAQKLQADATADERQYRRQRDATGDERHDTERGEDRAQRTVEQDRVYRRAAAAVAGEVVAKNAEAGKWKGLAERTKEPDTKAYYESLADAAKAEANAKALELREGYGDVYEAGPGQDGWAYVKQRPQKPAADLPTRRVRQPKKYTVNTSKYGLP